MSFLTANQSTKHRIIKRVKAELVWSPFSERDPNDEHQLAGLKAGPKVIVNFETQQRAYVRIYRRLDAEGGGTYAAGLDLVLDDADVGEYLRLKAPGKYDEILSFLRSQA